MISFRIENHVNFVFQDIDHVYFQSHVEHVIFLPSTIWIPRRQGLEFLS